MAGLPVGDLSEPLLRDEASECLQNALALRLRKCLPEALAAKAVPQCLRARGGTDSALWCRTVFLLNGLAPDACGSIPPANEAMARQLWACQLSIYKV